MCCGRSCQLRIRGPVTRAWGGQRAFCPTASDSRVLDVNRAGRDDFAALVLADSSVCARAENCWHTLCQAHARPKAPGRGLGADP